MLKTTIKPITLDDVSENYLLWLNDKEINKFLETRHSEQTIEKIINFVSDTLSNQNEKLFTIRRPDNTHIGNIKIGAINHFHDTAEISYFIGSKSDWGKGYASEAICLAVDYAFKELGLRYLKAGVYGSNVASCKALEKCGFELGAVLPRALLIDKNNNIKDDHHIYFIEKM